MPQAAWRKEPIEVKGSSEGYLSGARLARANIVQKELFMARCSHIDASLTELANDLLFVEEPRISVHVCRQGIDNRGAQFLASLMV